MTTQKLDEVIWQIVASIPKGRVVSYGQVAKIAGYPNHARYVGTTLKHLPKNTSLPWFRVINAKGEIAFPVNSDAYKRQRELLESEGIIFNKHKISMKQYQWQL